VATTAAHEAATAEKSAVEKISPERQQSRREKERKLSFSGVQQLQLTKLALRDPVAGFEKTYETLSQIPTLTELDLSFCEIASIPEALSTCKALRELKLNECTSLQSLPDSVGQCTALETLDLSYCTSLVSLPEGIGGCISLRELTLLGCTKLMSLSQGLEQQLESQGCQIHR